MIADAGPSSITGAVDAQNPWPGLESFKEEDQRYFHGRETEIDELRRLVLRERLTIFFGVSGLGKTSLLQAGLFPVLRQEHIWPVRIRLNYSEGMPELSGQIKDAIVQQAAAAHIETPRFQRTLWESFHHEDAIFWNERNKVVTPLLVFDQFEEIFTRGRETPERARDTEALLTELADLIEGRAPAVVKARFDVNPEEARAFAFQRHNYKVLLSLREDFLADLEGLSDELPSLMYNRLRLCPMNGKQALLAVTRAGGGLIGKDVAAQVVRFVGAEGLGGDTDFAHLNVEPALLSVFCRELNLTRIDRKEPEITAELLAGRQTEILASFYERGLAGIGAPMRAFIEDSLVTVGGRRNSEPYEEALNKPGVTAADISLLVNRRILRTEERSGMTWLELTHDRLTGVVRASRDSRRQLYAQAVAEAAERDARKAAQQARDELRKRTQSLRLFRALLVAAIAGLVVAIVGAIFGFQEQRRANAAAAAERDANHAAQEALADSHFRDAIDMVEHDLAADALPYLASALRLDPEHLSIQAYTVSLLSRRNWPLPTQVIRGDAEFEDVRLSPDGRLMVSSSRNGKVQMWDAETGEPRGPALVHQGVVTAVGFSRDGTRVVTASEDRTAAVWDTATGRQISTPLIHAEAVSWAGLTPDGTRVLTVSADGGAALWSVQTGKVLFQLRQEHDNVTVARLNRDGTLAVTGLIDGVARIWNIETGIPLEALVGHEKDKRLHDVQFSPDGTRVLTTSADGTARIWDVRTGRSIGTPMKHKDVVWDGDFSPDGQFIATASDDGTVGIWEEQTGEARTAIQHANAVYTVEFSPDGRRLVTTAADYTARVWEVETGRAVSERMRHGDWLEARFNHDGTRVITASWDKTLRLWDVRPSAVMTDPMQHSAHVSSARFSPSGRYVLTVADDKTTRVWDAETLRPASDPMPHQSVVTYAGFSPDESRVMTVTRDGAAATWSGTGWTRREPLGTQKSVGFSADWTYALTAASDRVNEVVDTRSGQPMGTPLRHESKVTAAAISPDATRVVTITSDGQARLWDAASGQPVGTPLTDRGGIGFSRFSPDGKRLLTASKENTARVWDARTGQAIGEPLRHYDWVMSAEFNQDGSRVVTASRDTAFIWNVDTGEIVGQPLRHKDDVLSVGFSPDGRLVVTASKDRTACLWDAQTGQPDGEPLRHQSTVRDARFNASGTRVVTASDDDTVRVWDLLTGVAADAGPLASLVEAVAGSTLSRHDVAVHVNDTLERITTLRTATAGATGTGIPAFIRWFLADRATRTISPRSAITVTDYNRHP